MLTDFGIARAIARAQESGESRSMHGTGTPRYMSPEQAFGERELDGRSDQYSLAVVLLEMIEGALPPADELWVAGSSEDGRRAARGVALPRTPVAPHVGRTIRRALALSPDERFESIDEFRLALVAESPSRLANVLGRRDTAWAAGALLVVAGLLATPRLTELGSDARRALATLDPRRVAVLYFDDHSADGSLGYLASGLTESLMHELSAVAAIQVVPRSGVKRFRDSPLASSRVARELGAGSLVEGSVQRSGGRVRVTVQLVDGNTDAHLASDTVQRPVGELFALEDDLAREVARLLRRRIGGEILLRERRSATRSDEARDLVYRADEARAMAEAATADTIALAGAIASLARADALLAAASRADPQWTEPVIARGWVALEMARRQAGAARAAGFARARTIASEALARDPRDAHALELRGTAAYHEALRVPMGDAAVRPRLASAQADLARAVLLDTTRAAAWATLSRVRVARGDIERAERDAQRALAMDAWLREAPEVYLSLYAATLLGGRWNASWRWCERGAADFPNDVRFLECRLTLLADDATRPPDRARADSLLAAAALLDPPEHARAAGRLWLPAYREMMAAIVHARAGDATRARAGLARARSIVGTDAELRVDLAYEEAYLALLLGDRARAIALLGDYLRARPSLASFVARHARWATLRLEPAFRAAPGSAPSPASSRPARR
jgi:TolB-like protein